MAMGGIGRVLWRLALAVGAGVALSACHQNGTLFAVDTTADTVDVDPGDGLCADAAGDCSLRAAVMEANALPGVEEIRLADGETYLLELFGIDDTAAGGDLDITEAVVITGDATIGSTGFFFEPILHVLHPNGIAELDGPDITGGRTLDSPGTAILNDAAGILTIQRSDIHGNQPPSAGRGVVYLRGTGATFFWSSTIRDHAGGVGPGASLVVAGPGGLNLQNATIEGVEAALGADGGAVSVTTSAGPVAVWSSTILGRWEGAATVTGSHVEACTSSLYPLPTSGGGNIESGTSCGFTEPSDQQATDPLLGPLSDNGGGAFTAFPDVHSPAIDTGATSACTASGVDALGNPRPNPGGTCDTGAVELPRGPDCDNPGPSALMQYCDLVGRSFSFLDLTGADLTGADHTNGGLHLFADFTNVRFVDSDLTNANLSSTTITDADFSGATMTSLRATNLTGAAAKLPTGWRQVGDTLIGPFGDVIGVDFSFADLSGVVANDLESAGADYLDADLTGAVFDRADFTDAFMKGADTTGASFVDAVWDDTVCPDGTLSTTNAGKTCAGHL